MAKNLKPGINWTPDGKLLLVHTVTKVNPQKVVVDTGRGKFAIVVKNGKPTLAKA
ncbi:MAG: hypothetical protein AAB486_04380 [Patescibacteria group bacterium]